MTDFSEHEKLGDELLNALRETPVGVDMDGDIQTAEPPPPSPTALNADRWLSRRGKELWSENKQFGTLEETTDFFGAAWDTRPELVENCESPRRLHFMQQLLANPDYKSLHQSTRLDEVASELAAASFAQRWQELCVTEEPEDELDRDAQAQRSIGKALDEAKSEVGALNDARDAFGLGGDGADGGAMGVDQMRELFEQIRDNTTLRRIIELAGRFQRVAQDRQRNKPTHGADEVVGIEIGDDLSRMVVSELSMLGDDDLEIDFLRRYAEGELQIEEVRAVEPEGRGPIVVVVDESGSMSGEPVAHAKAIALAMAWVARHQKRYCCLVGFAGNTEGNFLVIPPGETHESELMDWLTHFYSGGTTMDVPLDVLPKQWESLGCPEGKTDILMITDAIVNIPEKMELDFLGWKSRQNARVDSIILNSGEGDLSRVSDRTWLCRQLGIDSPGIAESLSI